MSSETPQESEQETTIDTPAEEKTARSSRRPAAKPIVKSQERLEVTSGRVLVIDQFMLANQQFTSLVDGIDASDDSSLDTLKDAALRYGGCVLNMAKGSYLVLRDPELSVIALVNDDKAEEKTEETDEESFDFAGILEAKGNLSALGQVFVDTRCLLIVDAKVVADADAVGKYREFRESGKDKKARDFIRSIGGAVRYGFNRQGDELGVFNVAAKNLIALWPDVVEHGANYNR